MEKRGRFGEYKRYVAKFEGRLNTEVRKQKKLNMVKKRDFRRGELPGKYMAKILYRWDDRKFKDKYLKKLEINWQK